MQGYIQSVEQCGDTPPRTQCSCNCFLPLSQIGVLGLVEKEWLVTLATIDLEDLEFVDYVECARQLLPTLLDQVCAS